MKWVIKTSIACLAILAGCAVLLYVVQRRFSPVSFELDPHTSVRFYSRSGAILDEQTHVPIAGAKIFLTDHPQVQSRSDSAGTFKLKEIRQWHAGSICVAAGPSTWPEYVYWDPRVTVSHTDYAPRELDLESCTNGIILLKKLESIR